MSREQTWQVNLELITTPKMPAAIDEITNRGYISSIISKYIEAVTLGHTGCGLIETSLYVWVIKGKYSIKNVSPNTIPANTLTIFFRVCESEIDDDGDIPKNGNESNASITTIGITFIK